MGSDDWGEFAIICLAITFGAALGALVEWLAVVVTGLGVVVCMTVAVSKRTKEDARRYRSYKRRCDHEERQ